jgi:hypothetical protein
LSLGPRSFGKKCRKENKEITRSEPIYQSTESFSNQTSINN